MTGKQKLPKNWNTAIVDFDGTLADTFKFYYEVYQKINPKGEIREFTFEEFLGYQYVDKIFGIIFGSTTLFRLINKTFSKKRNKILYDQYVKSDFAKETSALPGSLELLKSLKENNIRTIICSRGDEKGLQFRLECFGFTPYVDYIYATRHTKFSKPSREFVKEFIQIADISPENSIVIGDSMSDLTLAHRIGCPAFSVITGHDSKHIIQQHPHGPAAIYNNLHELAEDLLPAPANH